MISWAKLKPKGIVETVQVRSDLTDDLPSLGGIGAIGRSKGRAMPAQKPHSSKQDYATPKDFIAAAERKFGAIIWDLAATASNAVKGRPFFLGPGSHRGEDSLEIKWSDLDGLLWLNPPFNRIRDFAAKCAAESLGGAEILFLVPASVGANWYWDHVEPFAEVYAIQPRLSFDGKHPFPKDLILAHYAQGGLIRGLQRWRWKEDPP